jgi:dihydrodipicolinate synthase/N-acetylneuraminate lyase
MNKDATAIGGVLPVIQMPYRDNWEVDEETLAAEIEWLLGCGADGVVLAMVSEVLRLSHSERLRVGQRMVQIVAGRCPVILSVGAESTFVAREFARHAEQSGASAVMAIPPLSVAVSEQQLQGYYSGIVAAVDLPVIVQDASGYVGRPMSIELQAALLREFGPARIQFKPEAPPIGPRLSALRDATGGKARIFEGSGGIHLVDSFRRGIVGTMPGADLIRGIVALYRALEQGNIDRANELALPIAAIVAAQQSLDAFVAIEKHLLVRQGIFRNTLIRGPTCYELDAETCAEVDRLFDELSARLDSA